MSFGKNVIEHATDLLRVLPRLTIANIGPIAKTKKKVLAKYFSE